MKVIDAPGLVAALGFDGVQLVRALLHRGVSGRAQIGAALRSGVALPGQRRDVRRQPGVPLA